MLITDGWDGYGQARTTVFPHAQHLLCRFHALRAVFRRLRQTVSAWHVRTQVAARLRPLFHTADKRPVRRRRPKLHAAGADGPAEPVINRLATKLPTLLPAVGSTFRPATINAAERFVGAFERFYRLKGPVQNQASAEKHVALFLLGYVCETLSAEAHPERQGLCPLPRAGYQVAHIPLFHLLNRPNMSRLRHRIAYHYAQAA